MKQSIVILSVTASLFSICPLAAQPPQPAQEMRGTWLTTVSNLDWPDDEDTPAQQKQALISQLDQLKAMNVNTIIFQIRTECDAFYVSEFEPWSRYLTGTQGRAPSPLYDPLQFAIDETQRRGMDLHAWMNPYRAGVRRTASFHSTHISRKGLSYVETFDNNFWLDPGAPETVAYTNQIVKDVITRYDVDGLHFDDYFYPYAASATNPFPDDDTFAAFNPEGLSLGDWRRSNTESLISTIYNTLRTTPGKNHVKLGISPFGIYRPGIPAGISGLDSFNVIFIDSRKWLQDGIVDYMCPQLYWGRAADGYPSQQDYDSLISWWASPTQNPLGRPIIGGLPTYKVASNIITNPQHLVNMVTSTRNTPGALGNVHFRTGNLLSNSLGVGPLLQNNLWAESDVLIPASLWLDDQAPETPEVFWENIGGGYILKIVPPNPDDVRWNVLQYRIGNDWTTNVIPGWSLEAVVENASAQEIVVRTVDRLGNISAPVTLLTSQPPTGLPPQELPTLVQNFETSNNGDSQVMFRAPSTSGSTRGILAGSSTTVTTEEWNNRLDPLVASDPGNRSNLVQFTWANAPERRVRLTTINGGDTPNPQLDLRSGLSFAVKLPEGSLDLSVLIRETNTNGPIGTDGGFTGSIEQTIPLRVQGSANWQYIYIDLPKAKLQSFANGDESLDGNFGVFEGLLLQAVADDPTTEFDFYIDDIYQGPKQRPFGTDNLQAENKEILPSDDGWRIY
ncbi:MAG: glycoside hydrolase family 10 protein [Sumerlaeia bacterium]